MIEWKISKPGTQYNGVHLPVGCVYACLPASVIQGRHFPPKCVYCVDFIGANTRRHFTIVEVNRFHVQKSVYVDGDKGLYKSLRKFVRDNYAHLTPARPVILKREIAPLAPHDRKVGAYVQRPRKSADDNPRSMEHDFVTNRCKVGNLIYSNEMYEYVRMGVR